MVLVTLQSPVCLKPFVKAVVTLSKIGDECFFEITDTAVNLQAANSSTTAVIYFRFDRGFFSEYDSRTATVTRSQAAKSIGYAVKLSSRCLANSLKMIAAGLTGAAITGGGGVGASNNDESGSKHSSSLSVRYDTVTFECVHPVGPQDGSQGSNQSDLPDDDVVIRLYSSNADIGRAKTTTFRLRPLDTSEMMAADFAAATLRSSTNHLSAPAKKFSDLLANFATSDRNLLFCMSPTRFSLAADPLGKSGRWHRIGTDVGPANIFTKYEVTEEVNFGCILAELKTFLTYAVSLDWSPMLHIDFSQPGRPIVFAVEVTDRLGFGSDPSSSICMGSLVLSTMTLPAGVSAAAATAVPVKTPALTKERDKRQPQIDTVLKSNMANRTARQQELNNQEEVIDLDQCPSPTIRSSLESRRNKDQQDDIANFPTGHSPPIPSRRAQSIGISLSDVNPQRAPSPVSFLFAELFNSNDGGNRDSFMASDDVLAGDSDPE